MLLMAHCWHYGNPFLHYVDYDEFTSLLVIWIYIYVVVVM